MAEYIARCEINDFDRITARVDGERVELMAESSGEYAMEVYLDPAKARTFARGILALADEIDGGEAKEEAPVDTRPKVGDRVQIVRAEACSSHEAGRTGVVGEVDCDDPHLPYRIVDEYGHFIAWAREVSKVDEPSAGDPAPARSSRARFVEEAKELLGRLAGADDIIRLAEFLADGE